MSRPASESPPRRGGPPVEGAAPRRRLALVLPGLVFLLGAGLLRAAAPSVERFHVDEAHKLAESYYFHLFFGERDFAAPEWREDFFARTNPPVAKYVFGAALAAAGHPVRDRAFQEAFVRLWTTPRRLRAHIPEASLAVTRGVSGVYAALLAACLSAVAMRVGGAGAGLLAPLLLLGNPLVLRNASAGLTDTILLFHLFGILPVSLLAVRTLRAGWQGAAAGGQPLDGWRRAGWWLRVALLPGLVIALAAGSKLNGALAAPVYAGSVLFAALLSTEAGHAGRRLATGLLAAAAALAIALALFVAINPYFYQDSPARMLATLPVFRDWMVKQQIEPGPGLFCLSQRVATIGYATLRAPWLPLARLLGGFGSALTVLGAVVGVLALAARAVSAGRAAAGRGGSGRGVACEAAAVLWGCLAVAGGITLWIPVAWDRYLLPVYTSTCLLAAIGLAHLPTALRRLAGSRAAAAVTPARAGTLLALGLTALVMGTRWPVDPSWLDPDVFPELAATGGASLYEEALRRAPDSALRRRHAGVALARAGRDREALTHFERALALTESGRGAAATDAVLRCVLHYDVARARARRGEESEARAAFARHAAALVALRDAMVSGDPDVRNAYDDVLARRRRELEALLEAGGRPDARDDPRGSGVRRRR